MFIKYDKKGNLIGLCVTHVDDVLCGFVTTPEARKARDDLKGALNFGKFDVLSMTPKLYCGRHLMQDDDLNVHTSMDNYISGLVPARINRQRRASPDNALTEEEYAVFRSILGQLQWLVRMGLFQIGALVMTSASTSKPKISDLVNLNLAIRRARALKDWKQIYRGGISVSNLGVVTVADASWANLPGDRSGMCFFTCIADKRMLAKDGHLYSIAPVEIKMCRIKRVCRSTLAAETYAISDGSGAGQWLRGLLEEIINNQDLRERKCYGPEEDHEEDTREGRKSEHSIPLGVAMDAKSVFDHITSEKGNMSKDRRVAVELSILRQEQEDGITQYFWIPSFQNLADIGTKIQTCTSLSMKYVQKVLASGRWCLSGDNRAPRDTRGRSLVDLHNNVPSQPKASKASYEEREQREAQEFAAERKEEAAENQ